MNKDDKDDYLERIRRMEQKANSDSSNSSNPVAAWTASSRIVAFHSNFCLLTGSAVAALLYSQMWHWSHSDTAQERDGWFWLTQKEIQEQTGLTRSEQETARKRLRDLGLIKEEKRGAPMKLWFWLDMERYFELVTIHLESKKK